jgi:uncharacterized membrane protein YedE/YeeE
MTIDMQAFTPFLSLAGGMLIGLAAVILVLFNGRILGVSGIVGGLFGSTRTELGSRLAFIAGMLTVAFIVLLSDMDVHMHIDAGWTTLIIAGLLVGIGTRYGAGCTSGHGVCGLSRLSLRSLVATLCFMLTGMATVYVVRHVI